MLWGAAEFNPSRSSESAIALCTHEMAREAESKD